MIAKPGQAFLPSQHRQDVEDSRRGGATGQRHAQRLGHRAELEVVTFRECPHRRFGGFRGPRCYGFERFAKPADQPAIFRRQQRCRLGLQLERPVGKDIVGAVDQLDQGFGAP
jgi:hypothetical protein